MADSTQHAGPAEGNPAEGNPPGGNPAEGNPAEGNPAEGNPPGPGIRSRQADVLGLLATGWHGFSRWRRSRPFWAGLLLIIAGAELLLLPLPMNSMGLILHIGIGGISGILIGAVLIVAGMLLWFNPAQRTFYSIVAVLLAIAALVASNLGGFLIGTVLGVIGGSLGFAWTPLPPNAQVRREWLRRPTAPADTASDLALPAVESPADPVESGPGTDGYEDAADSRDATATEADASALAGAVDPFQGAASTGAGAGHGGGPRYAEAVADASAGHHRMSHRYQSSLGRGTIVGGNILLTLLGLITGLLNLGSTNPTQSADPPAASSSPTPGASASPSASPSPSPSLATSTSPNGNTSPSPGSPSPNGSPSPGAAPSPAPTGSVPPFALPTSQSSLTASSASITGFAYHGVVSVPTSNGSVQMMQFSASSLDLSGVQLAVSQGGATVMTTASSLDLTGHVTLYATKLSGDLLGVRITITPDTPIADILQVLGNAGVSQLLPLQMTNVTTLQPYTSANGMTASALHIS